MVVALSEIKSGDVFPISLNIVWKVFLSPEPILAALAQNNTCVANSLSSLNAVEILQGY